MAYRSMITRYNGYAVQDTEYNQLIANDEAVNRDPIWPPILLVSGTGTALVAVNNHVVASLGDASNDGTGYFAGFRTPADFMGEASRGLVEAKLLIKSPQTGNVRLSLAASWGPDGSDDNATTDSMAVATYAVTANQLTAVDISALFTGLVANCEVGFSVTRVGSDGADTVTTLYIYPAYLRLKQ